MKYLLDSIQKGMMRSFEAPTFHHNPTQVDQVDQQIVPKRKSA